MSSTTRTVFISYASEDYAYAKRLYDGLIKSGITCWLDRENLRPGEMWKPAIESAIRDSDYFIAVLSGKSVSKKGYVQKELKVALEVLEELPDDEIFLIPIRIDECEPRSRKIHELNWVNFFPSWDEGLSKVAEEISQESDNSTKINNIPIINDGLKRTHDLSGKGEDKVIIDGRGLEAELLGKLIIELAKYSIQKDIDYIVGVNRGGVMVGAYLAISIGLPSSSFVRAYSVPDEVEIDSRTADLKGKILVVDAVSRSGETLRNVNRLLKKRSSIESIHTTALVACADEGKELRSDLDYYPALSTDPSVYMPWSTPLSACNDTDNIREEFIAVSKKSMTNIACDLYSALEKSNNDN